MSPVLLKAGGARRRAGSEGAFHPNAEATLLIREQHIRFLRR